MTETSITRPPTMAASIPTFMNVTVLGLLAGLSFGVQLGLVPALRHLDAPAYLAVMHEIIPTFTHAVIPLMMIGTVTFVIRLIRRSGCANANYWLIASFAFFIAGALITVFGHFPINDQIMKSSVQDPPAAWAAWRDRWNELNFWRFAVAQLGFASTLLPLVFARRRGGAIAPGQSGAFTASAAPSSSDRATAAP